MNYFVLFVVFTFLVFIIYLKNEPSPKKNDQTVIRNKFSKHLPEILFVLILIIGIVVRTHRFGNIPNGVNVDEASTGYDAFALINYGIDMNGNRNPVALLAFGTGHQALYAYFSAPFIRIYGLNQFSIRITNLIFGILSLIIFYFLVRRIDNQKVAMFALLLIATNPWHVMISRWGLDCNLFPAIFLIATYLLTLSEEKPAFFILSMAIYGLALYSYEVSFFLVPVYILFLLSFLLIKEKFQKKILLIGLITIFIIGLPILLYLII
ncbi:MAG: glycosyltransferase family 39 protein, partial [Bacteroidales bacterium]|nr:glycosyltransferase family 39 protein [Bacteroidales bacterium]